MNLLLTNVSVAVLLLSSSPVTVTTVDEKPAADGTASATALAATVEKEKITDRRHPDYVRCKRQKVIGSLAKRRKVCMTNAQWAEAARAGNRGSREIVQDNQPGFYDADLNGP